VVVDRGQRIGDRADADPLDVGGVVARAAIVIVAALGDAVVDQRGEERRRHIGRVEPLDDAVAAHLDLDEVAHLREERGKEILECSKGSRVARPGTELPARARINSIM